MAYGSYGFPVQSTTTNSNALPPSGDISGNGLNVNSALGLGGAGNGSVPVSQINTTSASANPGGSAGGTNNGAANNTTTSGIFPGGGPNWGGGYGQWNGGSLPSNWDTNTPGQNYGGGYGQGSTQLPSNWNTPTPGANFGGGYGVGGLSDGVTAYADGGEVGGFPNVPGAGDPDSMVSSVKQLLMQGRQMSGLPATLFGGSGGDPYNSMRPSSNVESGGDNETSKGYADGGDVTEGGDMSDPSAGGIPQQPSPNPSQAGNANPQQMAGYLSGQGAMSPDIAKALEARVDPQGSMDPNARTLSAITAAGAPQNQWAAMQHYRQNFEAYKAFAQAAALGSGQKPGDMRASTHAATQAYQNVPDGNAVAFAPTQGGVHVNISKMGGGKRKGYAGGGDVEPEDAGLPDDSVGTPDSDAVTGAVTGIGNAIGDANKSLESASQNFVMSIPQYLSFLKSHGQYDQVMDKGMGDQINAAINGQGMAPGADGNPEGTPAPEPGIPEEGRLPEDSGAPEAPGPDADINDAINSIGAAPGPNAGQPKGAPAPAAPGASVGTSGSLQDFVKGFNKRNNANYTVGNAAPQGQVGNGQNPVAAGLPLPGSTENTAPTGALQGQRPQGRQSTIPDDIRRTADELFPWASQMPARNEYIAKQMSAREEQANKVLVAQNQHWYASQATGDARVQAAQAAAQSRVDVEKLKAQVAQAAAATKDPNLAGRYKALSSFIIANPGLKPSDMPAVYARFGINPTMVGNVPIMQAPAQQAPAQQAPAPGVQPPPGAKLFNGQWYVRGPDGKSSVPWNPPPSA